MATLTVKNVPDALVRRLKQQAALHRRSLNLEVISCLELTSSWCSRTTCERAP
jgi:plasmid stability protein